MKKTTTIHLETIINASVEVSFDLSRSIDLHQHSTSHTREVVIAGRTSGLIEKNEFVTWSAVHFGMRQTLSTKITAMEKHFYFEDVMTEGAFKYMRHEHHFKKAGSSTVMIDHFEYKAPFGFAGFLFDRLVLRNYMHRLLVKRNQTIKSMAESGEWSKYLATDSRIKNPIRLNQ